MPHPRCAPPHSPVTPSPRCPHLQRHRLLCAHRTGPFGVQEWSRQIERWLQEVIDRRDEGEWYIGRPLLVTAND